MNPLFALFTKNFATLILTMSTLNLLSQDIKIANRTFEGEPGIGREVPHQVFIKDKIKISEIIYPMSLLPKPWVDCGPKFMAGLTPPDIHSSETNWWGG